MISLSLLDYRIASVEAFGVHPLSLTWASLAVAFLAFHGMLSHLTALLFYLYPPLQPKILPVFTPWRKLYKRCEELWLSQSHQSDQKFA
jgi:hypothetical protein